MGIYATAEFLTFALNGDNHGGFSALFTKCAFFPAR